MTKSKDVERVVSGLRMTEVFGQQSNVYIVQSDWMFTKPAVPMTKRENTIQDC